MAAAHVLAQALFKEGKWVQAFPHFGVERRGAPVAAFVRFDETPIELRCHIYAPDYVIILDPTLAGSPAIVKGLKKNGGVLVNSPRILDDLSLPPEARLAVIDAGSIAVKYGLGTPLSPIVNTAILGAFARFSQIVSLEAVSEAVVEIIRRNADANVAAVKESYQSVLLPEMIEKKRNRDEKDL